MARAWSKQRLADIAELCPGKMLDQEKPRGEFLPYLANVNVRWGAFELSDLRQMRLEPHERERYQGKTGCFAPLFTGATIRHLPGQNLAQVEVAVPPLAAQQRIAEVPLRP